MSKIGFILYAKQVAAHIGTTDAARILDSYYMKTAFMQNAIATLGGEATARALIAANIKKSENELFYL